MSQDDETRERDGAADDVAPSLDDWCPPAWDPGVVEALAAWRQGHLTVDVPLAWVGTADADHADLLAGPLPDPSVPAPPAEAVQGQGVFRWAAVTSQTCDVAAGGPGARHPFVQVSPVISLAGRSENAIADIREHRKVDLVLLTRPPAPGLWAVDLRVSIPLSKAVLARNAPLDGFADEQDMLVFARRVAAKLDRPALDDVLSVDLVRHLEEAVKTRNKKKPEWWQKVEELRLLVADGTRTSPATVQLVVVEQVRLDDDERAVWRDVCAAFKRALRASAAPSGPGSPVVIQPLFDTAAALSAAIYRDSVPLRLQALGRPPR